MVTVLIVFDLKPTVRAHVRRHCSKLALIPLRAPLTSRHKAAYAQTSSLSVLRDTLRSSGRFPAVCAPLSDLYPSRLTKRVKGNGVSSAIFLLASPWWPRWCPMPLPPRRAAPRDVAADAAGQEGLLLHAACFSKGVRDRCGLPRSATAAGSMSATVSNV